MRAKQQKRRRRMTMLTLLLLVGLAGGAVAGRLAARRSLSATTAASESESLSTDPVESSAEISQAENVPPEPLPPESLPPETEAIAASVAGGLFQPTRGDARLVVISDLNGSYGSTDYDPEVDTAIALLPFWKPDMVLASGDMVAGQNPTLSTEQIRAMWAGFDEHVAAPLREMEIPFGFTIGNHDASGALGSSGGFLFQQERDLAAEYWQDAANDPGLEIRDRFDFPFYYTFVHDDIFFLAWDGSTASIPSEKMAWVEETLSSPEAQNAKLRVLIGHLPLYAVAIGRNKPGEVMRDADNLRAMFERYDVHTYISGHQHAYYPAHRGQLQLLHAGIIGSGPRQLIDSTLAPRKTITVIDIDYDSAEKTRYTTYDMRSLQLIEYAELPRFLTGHNGIVLRRDVGRDELTVDERSQCLQKLGEALCTP